MKGVSCSQWIRCLGWCFVVTMWLAVVSPSVGLAQLSGDFGLDNEDWNGLSELRDIANQRGVSLNAADTLNYADLDPAKPLFILYPNERLDVDSLERFLAEGGRIILADDYGTSAPLLERFGMTRLEKLPRDLEQEAYQGNPKLPRFKTPGRHPLLEGGVDILVGNHTAGFETDLTAVVYYDVGGLGFVYDLTIGDGKMIVVADSSIFINLMTQVADNKKFIGNALRYACDEPGPCDMDLLVGTFQGEGTYGAEPEPEMVEELDAMVQEVNESLEKLQEWVPRQGLMRWMTFLLVLGLVPFAVIMFPLKRSRFLSISFQPPANLMPQSEFERNLERFQGNSKANYALPIAILRDEFERLVLREVFGEGEEPDSLARYHPRTIEKMAAWYADRVGGTDSEEKRRRRRQLTKLMMTYSKVPARAQLFIDTGSRWGEKVMLECYQESLDILETLGLRETYERRTRSTG